jgi:hypothetical protein
MYFRLLGSERLSRPDEAQRAFASQNRDLTERAGDEIESLGAEVPHHQSAAAWRGFILSFLSHALRERTTIIAAARMWKRLARAGHPRFTVDGLRRVDHRNGTHCQANVFRNCCEESSASQQHRFPAAPAL